MSNIIFREGFTYKGFDFGWHKGELYRLPKIKKIKIAKTTSNRLYPLKLINQIKLSKTGIGYHIVRDKKSHTQLVGLTKLLKKPITIFDCQECK